MSAHTFPIESGRAVEWCGRALDQFVFSSGCRSHGEVLAKRRQTASQVAILLVFSAFITEMCFLASSAANASYLGFNLVHSLQLPLGPEGARLSTGQRGL